MTSSNWFVDTIEKITAERSSTLEFYLVKPGDTLERLILTYYGVQPNSPKFAVIQQFLAITNPSLRHQSLLIPGQIVRLIPPQVVANANNCPIPEASAISDELIANRYGLISNEDLTHIRYSLPGSTEEQEAFFILAWMQEHFNILNITTGTGMNTIGHLTSEANNAYVQQVATIYQSYRHSILSKSQYDYQRRRVLQQYAAQLGPFENLLFKGKTVQEAIRISRHKTLPATATIKNHHKRLSQLSQNMKYGGHLLTLVGLGSGCYAMAQADSRLEKNEILVETLGSALVGTLAGLALGVVLVSTPVGWGMALALGTATSLGTYAAGKAARTFYTTQGESIDFASLTRLDQLCR